MFQSNGIKFFSMSSAGGNISISSFWVQFYMKHLWNICYFTKERIPSFVQFGECMESLLLASFCFWQDKNSRLEIHLISHRLKKSSYLSWGLACSLELRALLSPSSRTMYNSALQENQLLFGCSLTWNWFILVSWKLHLTCFWGSVSYKIFPLKWSHWKLRQQLFQLQLSSWLQCRIFWSGTEHLSCHRDRKSVV